MPRNAFVTIPPGAWTQITSGDVSALRAQIVRGREVYLQATVGAVAPTSEGGSISLRAGTILAANLLLAEIWPGVAGATRVYAYVDSVDGAIISVSHA